jgi:regulatory protein
MSSECKYPFHEALVRLEAFCAYQERSALEVKRKALAWGFKNEETEELVTELQKKRFIDDARFAEAFVSGKYRFKKWGKIKIRFELKQKGITDSLIKTAFDQIDGEIYYQNLTELAARKWKEIKSDDIWSKRSKVMRFLSGKGYEQDLITDVVENLLKVQ